MIEGEAQRAERQRAVVESAMILKPSRVRRVLVKVAG